MTPQSHTVTLPHKRPETELLLGCARTRMEPDTTERVRQLLKERIDWNYLTQTAFHHGVLPLLSWNLHNLCSDDIPKTTLTQLKATFRAIAQWNLYVTGELLKLLNLFQDAGIRALPFKGPALAAATYGNLSLRHFGDLDVLMLREDILKAKDILVSQGYSPKSRFTPSEEAAYLRSHHDYKFVRDNDGVVVEIQWGITQWSFAFPIEFDDVWKRREEVSLAGVAALNLSPEDLLLILCVHGTKHRWEQLRWICDISELIGAQRRKIDWQRLMQQARVQGGERMVLLGLFLAHNLLGAVLPEQASKRIHNDLHVKCLAGQVGRSLFREASQPAGLLDESPFFYWQVRERLQDKLALLWRYFPDYFLRMIIPNEKDREFWLLPSWLSAGYYLIRPVRLIREHWLDSLWRPLGARKPNHTIREESTPPTR